MKKLLILLLGLLVLALLGYFCAYKKHAPAIQDDIHSRASAVFADEGFDWAKLSVDGRNITLTGIAPTEAHKTKAGELAKIYGYNLVDNQLTIAQTAAAEPAAVPKPQPVAPSPYTMKAELDANGQLLLTGYVPDAATHTRIVKLAQDKFGAGKVIDQLKEIAGAPTGWSQSVTAGLSNLQQLDQGVAKWVDHNLNISGKVASESIKTQVTNQVKTALPDGYQSVINLSSPAPVIAEPEPVPQMSIEEKVSAISCQEQFTGLLSNSIINFRTGSAEISTDSYALLDKLAAIAEECPAAKITIEGHTDSRGAESYNQQLSQNRAQAVVDFLVSKGVDATRLTAVGFGENAPIADNTTSEGRALNRRIEFTVKGIEK